MRIELKIKKNTWEEWEVRYLVNGVEDEEKTYYTDDYDDAVQTKEATEKALPKCLEDNYCRPEGCFFYNSVEGWCEQDCLADFYKSHGQK